MKTVTKTAVSRPDLSSRPFQLAVERTMALPPSTLYRAWTEQMDRWFAVPGSVLSVIAGCLSLAGIAAPAAQPKTPMTHPAAYISVSIDRPVSAVYQFASNPENIPKWAAGLGTSIKFWSA